jgi:hypothetical protein
MLTVITSLPGGGTEVTNGPLIYGIIGLVTLGFGAGAALMLMRGQWRVALGLSIGILLGVVFLALFSMERLVITATEIRERQGFPGATTERIIRPAELKRVVLSEVLKKRKTGSSNSKRSRRRVLSLALTDHQGVTTHYKPGGLWREQLEPIQEVLRKAGVEVVDER